MITGFSSASADTSPESACCRFTGCSMKAMLEARRLRRGSARMRRHSSSTPAALAYCSLPSSVAWYGSSLRSRTTAMASRRSTSAFASPPTLSLNQRCPERAAQGIEQRAVDERGPVARGEAVHALRGPDRDLRTVVVDRVAERGVLAGGEVGVARERERGAQLIDVLLVAERRVLVEPLGHQHFRRRARGLLAVLESDARAHESLRRRGERHDAEAERHPEPHVALEKGDLPDRELYPHVSPSPYAESELSRASSTPRT